MIAWLESQRSEVIALLVFGLSYIMVAVILALASILSRRRIAADLKMSTPTMLTPLSLLLGLLIAFLAARVWTNLDRANGYVAQEASSIRQVVILADTLPEPTRTSLRGAIAAHLRFIEAEDWPNMAAGRASLREIPPGLAEATRVALSFDPSTRGQQVAQQRVADALEKALQERRFRILVSQAVIWPVQWVVIALLEALILATIAMVHMDRLRTAAVNMLILSTGMAACLVLLMVHDRPFAAGGFTLEPAALRAVSITE
ncbi:MAG: DUF4239 domain-containing protein [Acetobacteraceae bacterium]|nr:DUF4239 domain-containing protein [Acetobacteraceae bacterium]